MLWKSSAGWPSDRVFLDAERGVVGGGLNGLDAVSVLDADHQDVSNLEGVVPVAAGKAANLEGERPLPSIARIRAASISDARGGNKPCCART
jgi:hypothetical protein